MTRPPCGASRPLANLAFTQAAQWLSRRVTVDGRHQQGQSDGAGVAGGTRRRPHRALRSTVVTIVEPGGFRTKWSGGAAVAAAAISNDYQPSVGEFLRFMESYRGAEPGDPARAAQALIKVAGTEEPPLRLLLGSDALQLAREASMARADEAEEWAELTVSTDYPQSA